MSSTGKPHAFIPEDEEAVERLQEELRFRGYAERTQETYLTHVRQFLLTLYSDGEESTEGIREYLLDCRENLGHSPNYANQIICALKFFYRYVRPDTVIVARFPTIRRPRRLPAVLSRMEVASIFANANLPRHRALLMFIYASGLRVSEVVKIRPRDIDEKGNSLRIPYGKGGSDRYTILSAVALKEIREQWPYTPFDRWIFPALPGAHLSVRTVQRAFELSRGAAGIQTKASVHSLRHSFATHLLERGTPLLYLQKLLGHRSPQSTLAYLHVTQKELTRIKSPLDDLVEGSTEEKEKQVPVLKLEPDQEARANGNFALASMSKRN